MVGRCLGSHYPESLRIAKRIQAVYSRLPLWSARAPKIMVPLVVDKAHIVVLHDTVHSVQAWYSGTLPVLPVYLYRAFAVRLPDRYPE